MVAMTGTVVDDVDAGVRPRLEDLAERQDGVVSLAQARRCGVSQGQVAWRRSSGRYRRSRRGVVRVAGVPPSWRQAVRIAAPAAVGPVAVSHASAARLFGLELPPAVHRRWQADNEFIELSAPIVRHVRLDGVRGHRSGTWEEGDIVARAGFAVTSPLRIVIDLSSRRCGRHGSVGRRHAAAQAADGRRAARPVASLRPAPGRSVRVLRAVVAARDQTYDPGESTLEARIRRVIRRKGFPSPVGQYWVRDATLAARLRLRVPGW